MGPNIQSQWEEFGSGIGEIVANKQHMIEPVKE